MACSIKETIAEYEAALDAIRPFIEADKDALSVNIQGGTAETVRNDQTLLNQRVKLLESAKATAAALQADGYPALPVPQTNPDIARDLAEQAASMELAAQRFAVAKATTFNVSFSAPKPKP